ncbi:unannotated protein [freshwater metagenome]|uniref:phosphoribosylamine--glycine ligase n=1 Tax=freshwater metagenome TaxID=449393 RepID=A0A6J5ZX62_9ZZZZ
MHDTTELSICDSQYTKNVKILVLGSGGREHAIVSTLLKDDGVSVWCAPGNAGIAMETQILPLDPTNSDEVLALAVDLDVDLVVIGPEAPLVSGVADHLREHRIAVFGPSQAAAQIEGSKTFAKNIMQAAHIPTARSYTCSTLAEVTDALKDFGPPYVVKDDGLAAGKGVVVTDDLSDALEHASECFAAKSEGLVVVEEFLDGPEVSLFGITDGITVVALSPAQDFKRIHDGDQGPNTGGMGAYSPLPWAPLDLVEQATKVVLQPAVDQMAKQGTPFIGLLYAGLALTSRGMKVIEFNARFGDPETQVVLSRLITPLSTLLYAAATQCLDSHPALEWSPQCAVTVVIAAGNYPGTPKVGAEISGLESSSLAKIFHSGTSRNAQGHVCVSGGRVLCVTALGADLTQARRSAYEAIEGIAFEGQQFRSDIALRAAQGEIKIL